MALTVKDLEKLQQQAPDYRMELVDGVMVEVKSPTDRLSGLREKIDSFLSQGTRVGILINPEQRWVEIRRLGQDPITLQDGDTLTVPDLLLGWGVQIEDLWSPEFDDIEDQE